MHTDSAVSAATVAFVVMGLAASAPSNEARHQAESAVAAAAQAKVAAQGGEVIAARREAQPYLDSARAGFVANDAVATSKGLRNATTFTQRQADSAAMRRSKPWMSKSMNSWRKWLD